MFRHGRRQALWLRVLTLTAVVRNRVGRMFFRMFERAMRRVWSMMRVEQWIMGRTTGGEKRKLWPWM